MTGSKKRLGVGLIANMVSICVSLGVSFFLTPFLISSIGKEAYSFFPLANNFVSYMMIISAALNSMASRFITVAVTRGDHKGAERYFSSVFFSNIILSVILLIPMAVIVVRLDGLLDIPRGLEADVRILFVLIFTGMLVSLMCSVFGVATFAQTRMDLAAIQSIGMNIIRAGLLIALYKLFCPTIIYMGVVTLVIALYNGLTGLLFTRYLLPDYKISRKYFDKASIVKLLKSGVWNSLNNLGSSLLLTVSLLMANTMIGASAGGVMSIVQTLPNFMTTVISTIFSVLLPYITVEYAKGNNLKTKDTVIRSQKILGIVSSVPAVIIIIYGKFFFRLWVPGEDAGYLQVLSIITILPLLLHSSMWTVYGLNIACDRVKLPAFIFLILGVINVAAVYTLLKTTEYGLIIIPLVSTICSMAYYLLFIPSYAACNLGLPKRTFYPHISKTMLFSLVLCAVFMPIAEIVQIGSWCMFFVICGMTELVGLMLYLIIVLNREDRDYVFNLIKRIIFKINKGGMR